MRERKAKTEESRLAAYGRSHAREIDDDGTEQTSNISLCEIIFLPSIFLSMKVAPTLRLYYFDTPPLSNRIVCESIWRNNWAC